jgi:flavin reductase (DIM6/NTAB) family NADH-FMN oxidoreductase RutF
MINESVNHEKIVLPPSTMLNPTPVVMVSCAGKNPLLPQERPNIVTIAWAGTVCSEPPMVAISVRPSRHSYRLINDTQEFVINLVNENLLKACDYCGVRSGDKEDKFASMSLTSVPAEGLEYAPAILESPLSLACKVVSSTELGSHTMFVAKIVGITADMNLFDKEGKLCLEDSRLITYSHGEYYALGKILGFFGHSVASPDVFARRMKEKAEKEKELASALDLAASVELETTQAESRNIEKYQNPEHKKTEFKKSRYSVSGPRKPGFSKSDEEAVRTAPRKPGFPRSGSRDGGYSRDAGSRDSRNFAPREGSSNSAPREGSKSGYPPRAGGNSGFAPRKGGNTSSAPHKPGISKPGFRKSEQGRDYDKPEGGRGRFNS